MQNQSLDALSSRWCPESMAFQKAATPVYLTCVEIAEEDTRLGGYILAELGGQSPCFQVFSNEPCSPWRKITSQVYSSSGGNVSTLQETQGSAKPELFAEESTKLMARRIGSHGLANASDKKK